MDPTESITHEAYAPGTHAVFVMPGATLSEALRMASNARLAELTQGCNVGPCVTLKHAGMVTSMLSGDRDLEDTQVSQVRP